MLGPLPAVVNQWINPGIMSYDIGRPDPAGPRSRVVRHPTAAGELRAAWGYRGASMPARHMFPAEAGTLSQEAV